MGDGWFIMVCRGCSGTHAVSSVKFSRSSPYGIRYELFEKISKNLDERSIAFSFGFIDNVERFLIITESAIKEGKSYLVDFMIGNSKEDNHQSIFAKFNNDTFDNKEKALSGGGYDLILRQDMVIPITNKK
jgi:hypothetical protein